MMTPIGNKVIIKELEQKDRTIGSIAIPDTVSNRAKTKTGTVVASGPGIVLPSGERLPNTCQPGDVVVFAQGGMFSYEGENYIIVQDGLILAKIE
jgi:chaperonin GroES